MLELRFHFERLVVNCDIVNSSLKVGPLVGGGGSRGVVLRVVAQRCNDGVFKVQSGRDSRAEGEVDSLRPKAGRFEQRDRRKSENECDTFSRLECAIFCFSGDDGDCDDDNAFFPFSSSQAK